MWMNVHVYMSLYQRYKLYVFLSTHNCLVNCMSVSLWLLIKLSVWVLSVYLSACLSVNLPFGLFSCLYPSVGWCLMLACQCLCLIWSTVCQSVCLVVSLWFIVCAMVAWGRGGGGPSDRIPIRSTTFSDQIEKKFFDLTEHPFRSEKNLFSIWRDFLF